MAGKQEELKELEEKLYTRRQLLKYGILAAGATAALTSPWWIGTLFPSKPSEPRIEPPIVSTTTSKPEKTDFQKFQEQYPKLSEGFNELDYKSALSYKWRFPEIIDNPDYHEHLNARVRYEDTLIGRWGGDPLSDDIFRYLRHPNLEYDLKVEEQSKEMFGEVYGYPLRESALSKDFPKKEDRITIHVSKAFPWGIEYFSLDSFQLMREPSMTTVVDNTKRIVTNDLPFELGNVVSIYNDENSRPHKLTLRTLEQLYHRLVDGTFAPDFHHPAKWFVENIDPLLLTDVRTRFQRFSQPFAEYVAGHSEYPNYNPDHRTYIASMLAKKVGGTVIETTVPRKSANYQVYHEENAQSLPTAITEQLSQDDLVILPGNVVSIQVSTFSSVKQQEIPHAYYGLPQREEMPYIINF